MSDYEAYGLDRMLTTRELADYLGVVPQVIYDMRSAGHGPCAVRIGKELRYRVSTSDRGSMPVLSRRGRNTTMPGRPHTEIGTYGEIRSCRLPSGSYQALSRYRDWDGAIRRVTATGSTRASAKAALWSKLADRDDFDDLGESVTPDTTFAKLAALWLEDIDLDVQLSRGTKETYAQEVRNLLMPPETRH